MLILASPLALHLALVATVSTPAATASAPHHTARVELAQWRGPRQPPPPPRVERVEQRRGHVWVPGNYEWRDNRYVWVGGRYEREQPGRRWHPGRWEWQGDHYGWIAGEWVEGAPFTGAVVVEGTPPAPPEPVAEAVPPPRAGFVWVPGGHEWRDGRYVWGAGHWEPERRGHSWHRGHWDHDGDRHVWHPGGWHRD